MEIQSQLHNVWSDVVCYAKENYNSKRGACN